MTKISTDKAIEWPTLALVVGTYIVWGALLWVPLSPIIIVPLLALVITLHSSLQHEVIHGHPTKWAVVNALLVWPAIGLFIPYARFRDSHLAHHQDARLTDPYDDPETNYFDPAVWARLPRALQIVLRINNTLAGRLILGPIIGTVMWIISDLRSCSRAAALGWVWHVPSVLVVLTVVVASPMSVGAYVLAAYAGLSLLKLRTYLEHQAHERASGRTVIIEDRGLFALLFLNNNLHVVHHVHPGVAWYDLPALYRANRDHYLKRNDGYAYPTYGAILRKYFWQAKDPVPHPLWPKP